MRLIDADALIVMEFEGIRFVPAEFIEDAEVIEERKRGRWIRKNLGGWHCSECDNQAPFPCMATCQYLTDFCPNCGADMRGENNG